MAPSGSIEKAVPEEHPGPAANCTSWRLAKIETDHWRSALPGFASSRFWLLFRIRATRLMRQRAHSFPIPGLSAHWRQQNRRPRSHPPHTAKGRLQLRSAHVVRRLLGGFLRTLEVVVIAPTVDRRAHGWKLRGCSEDGTEIRAPPVNGEEAARSLGSLHRLCAGSHARSHRLSHTAIEAVAGPVSLIVQAARLETLATTLPSLHTSDDALNDR